MTETWWTHGNKWLCEKAFEHFLEWSASKKGERWRKNRRRSPFQCGYTQPDWMYEAREVLGRNDEQTFKRLKLDNL